MALLRKISLGLAAIYERRFVHRDLKTANVMLRADGDPVIIDFGYCENTQAKKPARKYNVGSPAYMSPEAYLKSYYTAKSDVWSLGVIYHEMLTSKVLDENVQMKAYFEKMMRDCGVTLKQHHRFSQASARILNSTLKLNYLERVSAQDLATLIDNSVHNLNSNVSCHNQQAPMQSPQT